MRGTLRVVSHHSGTVLLACRKHKGAQRIYWLVGAVKALEGLRCQWGLLGVKGHRVLETLRLEVLAEDNLREAGLRTLRVTVSLRVCEVHSASSRSHGEGLDGSEGLSLIDHHLACSKLACA